MLVVNAPLGRVTATAASMVLAPTVVGAVLSALIHPVVLALRLKVAGVSVWMEDSLGDWRSTRCWDYDHFQCSDAGNAGRVLCLNLFSYSTSLLLA
jgi:hypothetical protein